MTTREPRRRLKGTGLGLRLSSARHSKYGPFHLYARSRKLYPFGVTVVGDLEFVSKMAETILREGLGEA